MVTQEGALTRRRFRIGSWFGATQLWDAIPPLFQGKLLAGAGRGRRPDAKGMGASGGTENPKVFPVVWSQTGERRCTKSWYNSAHAPRRVRWPSNRPSAKNKVQDQRNHGENQQQMYQSSCHVENRKSAQPCDQQDDEQYSPNAHLVLLSLRQKMYYGRAIPEPTMLG